MEDTLDFGSRAVAGPGLPGAEWPGALRVEGLSTSQTSRTPRPRWAPTPAGGAWGARSSGAWPRFVREYAPDAVVCTHFLPLEILIRDGQPGSPAAGPGAQGAQGRKGKSPPVYCVITDYMVHGLWLNEGVQRYFVASEPTRLALQERGVAGPSRSPGSPSARRSRRPRAPRRCAVSTASRTPGPC